MDYDITKAFNDGREHTCALLSQLVYTSDGEPMSQRELMAMCASIEADLFNE